MQTQDHVYCPALHASRRRCRVVTATGYVTEATDMGRVVDTAAMRLFIYGFPKDAVSGSDYMAPTWRRGYVRTRQLLLSARINNSQ
jgi:hypothetical protein